MEEDIIREPDGVVFEVINRPVTDEDRREASEAIAYYKIHGTIDGFVFVGNHSKETVKKKRSFRRRSKSIDA